MTAWISFLQLLSDFQSDSIGGTGVPCNGTGLNRGSYLLKLRYGIVEELLIAPAEMAFAVLVAIIQTYPIFHAAATADIKMVAEQAFIGKILLGAGEGAFFVASGEFF